MKRGKNTKHKHFKIELQLFRLSDGACLPACVRARACCALCAARCCAL
jgi:hypothetical protein